MFHSNGTFILLVAFTQKWISSNARFPLVLWIVFVRSIVTYTHIYHNNSKISSMMCMRLCQARHLQHLPKKTNNRKLSNIFRLLFINLFWIEVTNLFICQRNCMFFDGMEHVRATVHHFTPYDWRNEVIPWTKEII